MQFGQHAESVFFCENVGIALASFENTPSGRAEGSQRLWKTSRVGVTRDSAVETLVCDRRRSGSEQRFVSDAFPMRPRGRECRSSRTPYDAHDGISDTTVAERGRSRLSRACDPTPFGVAFAREIFPCVDRGPWARSCPSVVQVPLRRLHFLFRLPHFFPCLSQPLLRETPSSAAPPTLPNPSAFSFTQLPLLHLAPFPPLPTIYTTMVAIRSLVSSLTVLGAFASSASAQILGLDLDLGLLQDGGESLSRSRESNNT